MIREALNHLGKYRLLAGSVSAEVHRTPQVAAPDGGAVRRANAAAATTAAIAPGAVAGANAGRAYVAEVPEAGMGRDVLPRIHFLHQLSRERRRSDRSRAPLSIALFTFDGTEGADVDALLELVACNKRETDILGDLEHTTVSVLLPDTNEAGANRFVQKIMGQLDGSGFRTATATYPDTIFDSLATTAPKFDDTQPLLIFDPVEEPARWQRIVKRVLDILGASAGLLVLSPLMLAAAAVIKATSPGPIIFRQVRLGLKAVPFTFYKFRSMYRDADYRIHRDYVTSLISDKSTADAGATGSKTWAKLSDDPRITPIGRLLRNTSIDELPQLFNVLKGDMSLVGPRPPLPYEVEKYKAWHLRRILETKPGISGLWQVESRGQATFDEMVRLDLRYIRQWSLMLDLKILVKTVLVVIRRTGAR